MNPPTKSFIELVEATKSPTLQVFFVQADAANVEFLLSLNTKNRPLRNSHANWLAEMMARGEYYVTGQAITVSRDGVLEDGQHRLHGFRKVGFRPDFPLLVLTGADPRAGAAIDTGLKRTASDLMKFVYERPEATAQMMAVCRFHGMKRVSSSVHRPTPQQLLGWFEILHPGLQTLWSIPYASKLPAPVSCALAESILAGNDTQRILLFTRRITTGADCADGSPELYLRKFLDKTRMVKGGSDTQVGRYDKTVAALSYALQDKPMPRSGKNKKSADLDHDDTNAPKEIEFAPMPRGPFVGHDAVVAQPHA